MKRLTTDKPVTEMGTGELAHNSCYIKDGKVRYRDFDLDEDAKVLARKLLKDYAGNDDAYACDDNFYVLMVDYLQDGMDSIEGLIALFYRNLWAMADLREALKAYEDTGLSPEQIIEMDSLYADKCREVNYRIVNQQPTVNQWIPVSERLPEDDGYILLSFENFSVPVIGRYEADDLLVNGGAFYAGDEDITLASQTMFVNAWQPLPEPYRGA